MTDTTKIFTYSFIALPLAFVAIYLIYIVPPQMLVLLILAPYVWGYIEDYLSREKIG